MWISVFLVPSGSVANACMSFPEIMRVRIDRHQIHIHRQGEVIGDEKVFVSRRNVEFHVVLELQQHGKFRGRLRREVKPDAGLNHFRLPRWLQMCIQDQVRSFIQAQGHSVRLDVRNRARLPEQQVAVGIEDLRLDANLHAAETGARLALPLARRTGTIHQNVGVVHVALVARTNLNRFHPPRLLDWNGKNKVPVRVSALRRKHERLLRRQNHVGLSETPALDEFRLREADRRCCPPPRLVPPSARSD